MTTFSEQFPIVFQALNVGFVQTLKLFSSRSSAQFRWV